jgi:hypothetical protein
MRESGKCPNHVGDPLNPFPSKAFKRVHWRNEDEKSARKSYRPIGHKESCWHIVESVSAFTVSGNLQYIFKAPWFSSSSSIIEER